MASNDTLFYVIYIETANVTVWTLPDDDLRELCVEIKVDQAVVHVTEPVKRGETMAWDELCPIIGNSSSDLSLSIVPCPPQPGDQVLCIGCVNIVLSTLLDRCANDEFATLEMTSKEAEAEQPIAGVIRVKISEEGGLDEVEIEEELPGITQLDRFVHLGDLTDLDMSRRVCLDRIDLSILENFISNIGKEIELIDSERSGTMMHLWHLALGIAEKSHFECLGDLSYMDNAILNMAKAAELTDNGHSDKLASLWTLGITQSARFRCLGNVSDLENAIVNVKEAIALTDDGHPDKPMYLLTLGIWQRFLSQHTGNLSDLESAILNIEQAIHLTDNSHQAKINCLSELGTTQQILFERNGDLSDLENAILNTEQAVRLTDDGHSSKPHFLLNLGIAQQTRFKCLGHFPNLEDAISNMTNAVELVYDGNPDKLAFLSALGNAQADRFDRIGNISDLEDAILNVKEAAMLADDGNPNKPMCLSYLSNLQHIRFLHLGDASDFENAVANGEKAVGLMNDRHPGKPGRLSNLGFMQYTRFERFSDPSDLENAILNIEKAVKLTDDGHPDKGLYLFNLGNAHHARFERFGHLSNLSTAIANKEKAIELTESNHPKKAARLTGLASSQHARFGRIGNLSDLESAISIHEIAIELRDNRLPKKPTQLLGLANAQHSRFQRLGDMYDLENAISNIENALKLVDDGHLSRPVYLANLGLVQQIRFERLGDLSNLEDAICHMEEAVKLTDKGHLDKGVYLSNLANAQHSRFQHLRDLSDLEKAISNIEIAVDLADDQHPDKPGRLLNHGNLQHSRFEYLGGLSDLENAILNIERAVELTDDSHPSKVRHLRSLGIALQTRFEHLGEQADLRVSIASFRAAAQLKVAYPYQALSASRQWAKASHLNGDLFSALEGYRTALELLPKVVWLGLDTSLRQDWLLRAESETLGCLAATCAIQLGRLEEAVELLDVGRSIFWQQASSLRSDLQTLNEDEPELGGKLERIGRQLDAGNFSDYAFIVGAENISHDHQRTTKDVVRERRLLVAEWEELVERIRQLPQFKYFLRPIPFRKLRRMSEAGQVIIMNASEYGVDALIFSNTGPIEHVSLPHVNLEILTELSSNIVLERPTNASATQRRNYTIRFLKPALRAVWNNILVHIFRRIHIPLVESSVPPDRRIWWYPTGPLTFIPIHAAGSGSRVDVSRLVISSYVTTLGSHCQAQNKYQRISKGQNKLLAVSQPATPGQSSLPKTMEEVDKVALVFRSSGWPEQDIVCLRESEATVNAVSSALNLCSWVHFACHGSQDLKLGMKSALSLHDGHLELSEIAAKKLSYGQFAFLSACQAASGLKDLPGEAMHLAAGLQFAGFPSVIATMWNICDADAPDVANHIYQYLFRNGLRGLDPSQAAMALNRAILRLREDPGIMLDQWAPFIHFGI